ncbi:hypothetical protein M3J09_002675 [Ascochyta lentis]
MTPQKRPSPDRQNLLYSPHLQGMEQPVQPFKSSARSTPHHARSDKPLPPIPRIQKTSSSSSVGTLHSQFRSTGFSLWESPSNWDNGENSQTQSSPFGAARNYSLMIPEPPEDIAAVQMNPTLWQLENGPFPQTPLQSIYERTAIVPGIPARNPSRLSLSLSNPVLTRKASKDTVPSVSPNCSKSKCGEDMSEDVFKSVSCEQLRTYPGLTSPLDLTSTLSDETMKGKEFPSSSLESPRDQGIVWESYPQRSDSLQLGDNHHLNLRGQEFITFRKRSILVDDSPASTEDPTASDKAQALSLVQEYHTVPADQSQGDQTQHEEDLKLNTPPKDRDLTPRPLAWKKEAAISSTAEASERPQAVPSPSSERHRNLKKMGSWVSHHLKKDSHTGLHQKRSDTSQVPSQQQLSVSEVDRPLKEEVRLKNIVQHGKDLVSRRILRRDFDDKRPLVISSPIHQHPPQPSESSSLSEAPFQLATPLFRLPGGLALVRSSPTSTPRPHTASVSPTSPLSDSSWPDFPASSPFRFDFSRRSSWQSSQSRPQSRPQSQGTSTTAIKSRLHSFIGASSSLRSFSRSTTSLAHQEPSSPSPYNPPQPRRRSHNVGSPLTSPPTSYGIEQRGEEDQDDAPHRMNLFEKAKSARDAWRKHQRDVKTEKLKQSIRLVGPADARGVAGYINFDGKVDGRVSGDSGVGEGQLPGYAVSKGLS